MRLFGTVVLFSHRSWREKMPTNDTSPARFTHTLTLAQSSTSRGRWMNTDNFYRFFAHLQSFQNVKNLILSGWDSFEFAENALKKYFTSFGKRLQSLELAGELITPDSFLVLLGLFPNLEDLYIKERLSKSNTKRVLKVLPKLSGRLTIRNHSSFLFYTLCKIPLRFREIRLQEHEHDYQELIDACGETLKDFRAMCLDFGESGLNTFAPKPNSF